MPYGIGFALSLGVAIWARWIGFDRDRAFYATVAMVVASYYVLFAAMTGFMPAVLAESVAMMAFWAAAALGFKGRPWLVVTALVGHGVFDALHGEMITNPGVPAWWPAFCLAYDVGAGGCLAWSLSAKPLSVRRA